MRAKMTIPAGIDFALYENMGKLVRLAAALNLQVESIGADGTSAELSDAPVARPGEARIEKSDLGASFSPLRLDEAAADFDVKGLSLVKWDSGRSEVTVARLLPFTRYLRDRAAEMFPRACRPWELELQTLFGADGEVSEVVISRSPVIADADKRRDFWLGALDQIVTSSAASKSSKVWRLDDNGDGSHLVLTYGPDPLAGIVLYDWDVPVSYERVPFAIDEFGNVVNLALIESNALLGGIPGGGKSGGATALLAGISRLSDVALIGLDPKEVELPLWEPRMSRIAYDIDNIHATAILRALVVEMSRRYTWCREHGVKKVTASLLSPSMPLLVVFIDELAELVSVGDKEGKAERAELIRRLIAKGRAAGIVVIAATQKPAATVIPTDVRDIIAQRVGFATTNRDMTDTILGAGMSLNGGLSHEISAVEKGVAYIVNETSRVPRRARAFWIPDEDVAGIAARTAHLRVDLPWLPTEAQALAAAAAESKSAPRKDGW